MDENIFQLISIVLPFTVIFIAAVKLAVDFGPRKDKVEDK